MDNPSILAAFERMWQHVVNVVGSKADIEHGHDDKYYTEKEVDTKLSGKADSSHTHEISNVNGLKYELDDKVPTSRTVNGKDLNADITLSASDVGAAPSSHDHDDKYYTETEVDTKLNNKADKTHDHDDRYYTETEVDTKLSGKSDTTHNHDDKYDVKGAADSALESAKTYTNSSVSSKADVEHNHDDVYYTESEIDAMFETITVEVDPTLSIEGMAADAAAVGELADNVAYVDHIEDGSMDFIMHDADTLGGKTESMLSVAKAVDADNLGGTSASNFVQKNELKPKAGFIYPLATATVPDGFLLCDGKAYSRDEYQELYAVIGTKYGAGDGSTTFNVPDLQTRVPVGAGSGYALGDVGGEEKHALTEDENAPHVHSLNNPVGAGTGSEAGYQWNQAMANWGNMLTKSSGSGQPHNNMQPYTVVNYIISTGKNTSVYISDIINGVQAMPLEVKYGGTGATTVAEARKNLGAEYKRNLLDNSDFTNPVNQRGLTIYSADTGNIDRWVKAYDTTVAVCDGYISTTGFIHQRLEKHKVNQIYTLACKALDGTVSIITGAFEQGASTSELVMGISASTGFAYVSIEKGGDYVWAALYEGEYTAETLPPYIPKGYAAELMECMRYYQIGESIITFNNGSSSIAAGRDFIVPMRVKPTLTIYGGGNFESAANYIGVWGKEKDQTIKAISWNSSGIAYVQGNGTLSDSRVSYGYIASADL